MAKNAKTVADDDKPVTEADLRADKYEEGVESSKETDETSEEPKAKESEETSEEDGKTDDQATEETEETAKTESAEETSFVKEFPQIKGETPEEYARELERLKRESDNEGKRLADKVKELEAGRKVADATAATVDESEDVDPRLLYADGIVRRDAAVTYEEFRKDFPQTEDEAEYEKFVTEVSKLSRYILETEKRAPLANELYVTAAAILGWEKQSVSSEDRLKGALKDSAASPKTVSATKKIGKSKVTDAMLAGHRVMYPNDTRSDSAIREELEPYVQ